MPRKPIKPKTNIFEFQDFRLYLKALVKEFKTTREGFTMRSFAEGVGFGSPSFLKMIIDGQRSLKEKPFQKICDYFHLKDREKDYFRCLVDFTQCKDPDVKKQLTDQLDSLRPRVTYSELKKNQRKYFANDYYAAIREMVLLQDFKEDSKWIAAKCLPRIKPAEAREAIEVLLELGFLKRDDQGRLTQSDPVIDTGAQAQAEETFTYHEAVLNKARKYLSLLDQGSRNFSALTIPIPKSLEKTIAEKIYNLQNEILDLVNDENLKYDSVYQFNIQLFPVTTEPEDDGD